MSGGPFSTPEAFRWILIVGLISAPLWQGGVIILRDRIARKRAATPPQQIPTSPMTRLSNWYMSEYRHEWITIIGIIVAVAIWLPLFITLIVGLFTMVPVIVEVYAGDPPAETAPDRLTLIGFAALTATLGALVAFPLTVLRTQFMARQTEATEQGLLTDRINTAVEGLGGDKTVRKVPNPPAETPASPDRAEVPSRAYDVFEETVPNIVVRLGAIYSLERIAQDSERDHIQIMEILCAYLRDQPDQRTDIQAAITVIGRRSDARIRFETGRIYRLDLCGARLQNTDLSNLNFERAWLQKTQLERATLRQTRMEGAQLDDAEMQSAFLHKACMQRAEFWNTHLQNANLDKANLDQATLLQTQMQSANLTGAQMQQTVLTEANMAGANLTGANMAGAKFLKVTVSGATSFNPASLKGAGFHDVDLSMLDVSPNLFAGSFGDGTVTVPAHWGNARPNGWITDTLTPQGFEARWRGHQGAVGYHAQNTA